MIFQTLYRILLSFALAVPAVAQSTPDGSEPREGGLTGTGIVGEITELGSIIVNGQRISFDPGLPVKNAIAPKRADALVPGDVVAVAVAPRDGQWTAQAISDIHPLIGPVENPRVGRFTVLGVDVLHPANAAQDWVAGDWVAISGFWARDLVVATRIQQIPAQDLVSIQGSYRPGPSGATSMIGPVDLQVDTLQHAQEGDVIRMQGRLQDGVLLVQDIHLGLFEGPVGFVLAEGYLTEVAPSGHYTIAGSGLSSYTENLDYIMTKERISACGQDGQLAQGDALGQSDLFARLGCLSLSN